MNYKDIGYLIPIIKGMKTPARKWKDKNGGIVHFKKSDFADCDTAIVPKAGILIIDVDDKDGRTGSLSLESIGIKIGDTLTQQTKNGHHLFYRIPDDCILKNCGDILSGIDLRTPLMGYVIYKDAWLDCEESDISIDKIAPLPKFALDILIDKTTESNKKILNSSKTEELIKFNRNNTLTAIAGGMWSSGMSLCDLSDKIHGINARRCSPSLPISEVETIIKSISSYKRDLEDNEKSIEENQEIAKSLLSHYFKKIEDEKIKNETVQFPENICNVNGMLKTLSDAINMSGQYITPHLSIACAVSLMSVLCGKRYESPTGARTNLYIIGLGMAGAGKENARKIIIKILSEIEEGKKILGGSSIKSGAGLIKSMTANSQRLYMLDEFGLILQSISNEKAPQYLRDISRLLLEFYSSSGSSFLGCDAASEEASTGIIKNPILGIYGTSTPSTFYKSITDQTVISGELPRYIIVDDPSTHKIDNKNQKEPDYKMLTKMIGDFISYKKDGAALSPFAFLNVDNTIKVQYESKSAELVYKDFRNDINTKHTTELMNGLWSRACENAQKLASIAAISDDYINPKITVSHIRWAIDFVSYSLKIVESRLKTAITSKYGELRQKLVFFIAKSKTGVTKTQIRQYMQMKTVDLDALISDVIEIENIEKRKITGKSCKPITLFIKK